VPKLGTKPIRRAALVQAAIHEIGAAGSLDVTVSQIASRAGMSSGLAHHYFGSKDALFLAAMRHILTAFGARARHELESTETPRDRLNAIIAASFSPENFEAHVVSAWLIFYVKSQNLPGAKRLLRIYISRLRSNLLFALRGLTGDANARVIAQTTGALIDGLYIRHALGDQTLDRFQTMALVWDYLNVKLQ